MTVYIEYVLIDNFVIDFFLLSATHIITGKRGKTVYRIIAAASGAVFALIYPLISDFGALTVIFKIASGFTVVFAAAKYNSVKDYFVNAALFFALTFFTGGAIIGIYSVFGISYSGETAIAIAAFPVYAVIKTFKSVFRFFCVRAGEEKNTYDCEITLNGNSVKLKGFMDTGNSLYDGDSPVVVCNKKTALLIIGDKFPKIKYIPISTAIGKSRVLSFKADELKIFISGGTNIYNNVTVAATVNAGTGYDLILHPALKEKENERNIAS